MGRTQATYRMRLLELHRRLGRYHIIQDDSYQRLWESAQKLTAPASTLPYADTHAIASFCMILDVIAKLDDLENRMED